MKDGEKRKIFCQCKRKGFCLLQFERKGAMNLVQDLSLDSLLSIRQLRIKMRNVEKKRQVEMRQNKLRYISLKGGCQKRFLRNLSVQGVVWGDTLKSVNFSAKRNSANGLKN